MRQLVLMLILTCTLLISISHCASSATSFCKCTCKGNSTIIPLNPKTSSAPTSPNPSLRDLPQRQHAPVEESLDGANTAADDPAKSHHAKTCNDCNRKLCLSHNLPRCKGVREEEIFTTCFQRDSLKDEAVVFIFIIATAGLLVWALLKPYVQKWMVTAQERREYTPLSGHDGGHREST